MQVIRSANWTDHLCPLMTISSPSLRIDVLIFRASEDETARNIRQHIDRVLDPINAPKRSVMENAERISPRKSGINHFCCWSGEPYRASTSAIVIRICTKETLLYKTHPYSPYLAQNN